MKKLFTVLGLVFLLTLGSIGGASAVNRDWQGVTWNVQNGYENILLKGVGLVTIDPQVVLGRVATVNNIGEITNIADVDSVNTVDSVTNVVNIADVDSVNTVDSVTNMVNLESVDNIDDVDSVNTMDSITNVVNLESVDNIDDVDSVNTIDSVTNVLNIDDVDSVNTIDSVTAVESITNGVTLNNLTLTVIKPTVTVAQTSVNATSVNAQLIGANSSRKGLIIQNNDDTDDIYIALENGTASATFGLRLNNTGGSWVMGDHNLSTATINVFSADTGLGSSVLVTEF